MSWKATAHVLDLAARFPDLSVTQMAVLYAIAGRHNHEYHCAFGSLRRVAADAHVHQVTASSTISDLEDLGVLRVYEGQLPRKKSDPDDRRMTRGTMWCFIDLDPDDGPDIEGATPRVRTSGRPPGESISPGLNHFEAAEEDELAGTGKSISPGLGDELAGPISPFKAGYSGLKPESPLQGDEPEEKPASARALDEAAPQRAPEAEPAMLRPDAKVCPICAKPFTGPYAEHRCPINRPPSRKLPPRVGKRVSFDELRQVEAQLAEFAAGRAGAELPPDLAEEHARFLAVERERERAAVAAAEKTALPQEASP